MQTDDLTGLQNRRFLDSLLKKFVERSNTGIGQFGRKVAEQLQSSIEILSSLEPNQDDERSAGPGGRLHWVAKSPDELIFQGG